MRLYHYTSLENFWKIWVTKKLLFSKSHVPSNNDFFERNKSISCDVDTLWNYKVNLSEMSRKIKMPNVFYQLSLYKQISFTKDYYAEKFGANTLGCLSPMMWGQYADNGNGVCIEIESQSLDLNRVGIWYDDIDYVDKLSSFAITCDEFKTIETINNAIESQMRVIFFQKNKCWEAENEFRVIAKGVSSLDIRDAIRKIIVPSYDGKTAGLVRNLVLQQNLLYFLTVKENSGCKELSIAPFPNNKR